jgi:hypothetical protein
MIRTTAVTVCATIGLVVAAACGGTDKIASSDGGLNPITGSPAADGGSIPGHGSNGKLDGGDTASSDAGTKTSDGWQVFYAIDLMPVNSFGSTDLPPSGLFFGMLATPMGAVLAWNWQDPPDPNNPIVIGSGFTFIDGGQVWRSTDIGRKWLPVTRGQWTSGGATDANSVGFVREPSTGALYGWYGGVIRSQDDGKSWSLISPASLTGVRQLFVRDARTLFVLHNEAADDAGEPLATLSRSDDGGATFAPLVTDVPKGVLVIDKHDTLHVFADTTLWRRFAHDSHWYSTTHRAGNFGNGASDATALPDGTLLMSDDAGVNRSIDYGDTWTVIPNAPSDLRGWLLDGDRRLYASDTRQIFVSGDLGKTWQSIGPEQPSGSNPIGVFTVLPDHKVLLASSAFGGKMFLSPTVDVSLGTPLPGPVAR